uniref:Uncharacterized protein n=1 Tax=Romanomermis culicivorax TaxID=13658 RepID=A0A915I3W5_ROMCU
MAAFTQATAAESTLKQKVLAESTLTMQICVKKQFLNHNWKFRTIDYPNFRRFAVRNCKFERSPDVFDHRLTILP